MLGASPRARGHRRLLMAALLLGPALVIALVFLYAPKAETPRDEALPVGDWRLVGTGMVHPGGDGLDASGRVLLLTDNVSWLLRFEHYDAVPGSAVWFWWVPDAVDVDEGVIDDEGVRVRVPGPGQATYRGTFHVPLPGDLEPRLGEGVVAWDGIRDRLHAWVTLDAVPEGATLSGGAPSPAAG